MTEQTKRVPQPMLPRGFMGRLTLMGMNLGHRSIYQNVARVLEPQPEDDLLEVGCGNGYFLKKYASNVRSIAGLDLSELCVEMAKKKHRKRIREGTAEIVHGEASRLPWEDGRFSVVTSMGSFIGFPQPLESLKEMHRVLRPGGRAVVCVEWHAEDGLDHTKEIEGYGMKMWTEDEMRAAIKEAGFSEVSFIYAKGLKMPKMMMARAVK